MLNTYLHFNSINLFSPKFFENYCGGILLKEFFKIQTINKNKIINEYIHIRCIYPKMGFIQHSNLWRRKDY